MLNIDIIIPVYNAEEYLERCINSIDIDTNRNVTVILVNDGSTDNSLMLCKRMKKKYKKNIKVINQENKGVSDAKNAGLEYVSGDYITFMDPDDAYDIGYIKKCVQKIKKFNNPDLVITPYKRVYGEKKIVNDLYDITNEEIILSGDDLLKTMYGMNISEVVNPAIMNDLSPVWGKFYKKSLILGKKFADIKEVGSEDLLFNINILKLDNKILYIPECYYLYTKTNNSSITTNFDENLISSWENLFSLMKTQAKREKYNTEYFTRLDVRQYLSKMSLVRAIYNSKNLTVKNKVSIAKKTVKNPEYNKFKYSDFPNMISRWKILMWLCDHEYMYVLYIIIRLLEPYKNKLK